ncbi:MAG: hypothetical protein COZ29_00685 [Candidatus Moranbacteria bacterium CG_4_10_14_3_um_filter_45_9]|nr:MAG: hypothetical protein COZ29_00685 [Candidatus Moranbacteria bacterium CG_4_10_14_3_um_filter_45_9]
MTYITDVFYTLFIILLYMFSLFLFLVLGVWYIVEKLRKRNTHSVWFKRLGVTVIICMILLVIHFVFESGIRELLVNIFGLGIGDPCPAC